MNNIYSIENICSIEDIAIALKEKNICIDFRSDKKSTVALITLMLRLDKTNIVWRSGVVPSGYIPTNRWFISTEDDRLCLCSYARGMPYTPENLLDACERQYVPVDFDDLKSILSIPE